MRPPKKRVIHLARALGRTAAGLEVSDNSWRPSREVRVSRTSAATANGRQHGVVPRVAGVSQRAIHQVAWRQPATLGTGRISAAKKAIANGPKSPPPDRNRMVAAREPGISVIRVYF